MRARKFYYPDAGLMFTKDLLGNILAEGENPLEGSSGDKLLTTRRQITIAFVLTRSY